MPFLQSFWRRSPSADDLERGRYERQVGADDHEPDAYHDYSEDDVCAEKRRINDPPAALTWAGRLFGRSPAAINAKRRELLLPPRSSRDSNDASSSSSGVDSDEGTFCADEPESPQFQHQHQQHQHSAPSSSSSRISARVISDAIIGLSDGLTVPFALTAGLSALGDTRVVIFAGLAELTAGAISMGLGGYLGARSEEDSHAQTLRETRAALAFASTPPSPSPCAPASPASCASSTTTNPAAEAAVLRVFAPYDLPPPLAGDLARHLARAPTDDVVDFLMRFEHGVPGGGSGSSSSSSSRPLTCALTIAGAYFLGGFVPLVPYFLVGPGDGGDGGDAVLRALWWSLGVMAASLFAFGYAKTCFVTGEWRGRAALGAGLAGAAQMVVVGGIAAGCAMGLVRLFNSFAG